MVNVYFDFELAYLQRAIKSDNVVTIYCPKVGRNIETKITDVVEGRFFALDSESKRRPIHSGYYPIYDERFALTF